MRIEPSNGINLKPLSSPSIEGSGGNEDFGKMLKEALSEVNASQSEAADLQTRFAQGQPAELHQVMIAMEKASVAMQLTLQVRNKLLEAYQEISRMQI